MSVRASSKSASAAASFDAGACATAPRAAQDDAASYIARIEGRQSPDRQGLDGYTVAELLQRFHATAPVTALLTDSRALVAKTKKDERAIALVPVDWVQWTDAFAKAATQAGARAQKELGATKLELRLIGRISAVAKKELAALGWTVVDGVK